MFLNTADTAICLILNHNSPSPQLNQQAVIVYAGGNKTLIILGKNVMFDNCCIRAFRQAGNQCPLPENGKGPVGRMSAQPNTKSVLSLCPTGG
jgi:hypothetical protein